MSYEQLDGGVVFVETRKEAEDIVSGLKAELDRYGRATMADLKGLMNIPTSYFDTKWGWLDLSGVKIAEVDEGCRIDFPAPVDLG